MEIGEIMLLRLYGGELLMGKNGDAADAPAVLLEDPRLVVMVPTMRGEVQVAMRPVCAPFTSKRLEKSLSVPRLQVMFSLGRDEIGAELVNGYLSDVSGIKLASASDVTAMAGKSATAGEFSLR